MTMDEAPPLGFGLPLKCPKCSSRDYFGILKTPSNKTVPCPNCNTKLEAIRKKGRRSDL